MVENIMIFMGKIEAMNKYKFTYSWKAIYLSKMFLNSLWNILWCVG